MFNYEQFPINDGFRVLSPEAQCSEAAALLDKGHAVYAAFEGRDYLFTPEDASLFETAAGTLAGLLSGRSSLVSPAVVGEPPFKAGDWIADLPAGLRRPIVFRNGAGDTLGYCMPGEALRHLWRLKRHAEAYFATLAETVTDAVTAVDRNGSVICWNEAAETIYGIPRRQIVGRRIGEHFESDSLVVMRILDEGRSIRNTYHRPRQGTHVLINASPIRDAGGAIIGGLAAEQDITHLVKLNEELSSAQASKLYSMAGKADPFSLMGGQSESIGKVVRIAKKVAESDTPVLLTGEAGTGKEQLAEVIHLASARSDGPFMTVNCGAAPAGMLESELFGFQGGAFSGQETKKAGKLETASGGTLLLNEIDKLPPELQDKLLHAIKRRTITRLGGHAEIPVQPRIIGATSRNLETLAAEGRFRPDLYYAISVISIALPPLRDRKEDIAALFQIYLREFSLLYQKPVPAVEPEVALAFANYDWPGNMTELRAVTERCVILSEDDSITLDLLPEALQKEQPQLAGKAPDDIELGPDKRLKPRMTEAEEAERIEEALAKTSGNKSTAARLLGVSRGTLYNKMRKYGIT